MPYDLTIQTKQIIALLNLSTRDAATNVATYDTTLADTTYSASEITRANQSAVTEIMKAIAETDGHPHRALFTTATALTHAAVLPTHFGSIGVPRITPFTAATYTLIGKRKSIEEIASYRANPGNLYSLTPHDTVGTDGFHSKLAGFYAIDGETFYFTGFSAVSDLASFVESDYTKLPDVYYPLGIALAIANLKKDGDVSDVFSYYAEAAAMGLKLIRMKEMDQPSMKKTLGARDSGAK